MSETKKYWTPAVDLAIIQYNAEKNMALKNRIFEDSIYAPMSKLSENLCNIFKTMYVVNEDIESKKQMCLSYMVERLDKFDPTRNSIKYAGKKTSAFGWMSLVGRNYLINLNNAAYKKSLKDISSIQNHEDLRTNANSIQEDKSIFDIICADDIIQTDNRLENKERSEYLLDMFNDFYREMYNHKYTTVLEKQILDRYKDILSGKIILTSRLNNAKILTGICAIGTAKSKMDEMLLRWGKYTKVNVRAKRILHIRKPIDKSISHSRTCPTCKVEIIYYGESSLHRSKSLKPCKKCNQKYNINNDIPIEESYTRFCPTCKKTITANSKYNIIYDKDRNCVSCAQSKIRQGKKYAV